MSDEKLNPQEIVVKKYLEEQIQKDAALKTLYVPSKIKDCFKYITELARKKAVSGCAMVEDSLVFKWARDYFLEELPKMATKAEVKTIQEKEEVRKEVTVIKDGTRYDKDGCGLLFDFD